MLKASRAIAAKDGRMPGATRGRNARPTVVRDFEHAERDIATPHQKPKIPKIRIRLQEALT
jgi:hypothetical protein